MLLAARFFAINIFAKAPLIQLFATYFAISVSVVLSYRCSYKLTQRWLIEHQLCKRKTFSESVGIISVKLRLKNKEMVLQTCRQ